MHALVRQASTVTVAAVCLTLSLGAQQPQSTTAPDTAGARAQSAPGTMTLTGCIERADQIAAGAPTPAATTADSQQFVLIKAESPAAATAVGTTGTAGAASAPAGSTYRLDGDVATIAPHLGHRVEITGSIETPTGTTAVAATPDPANPGAPANPLAASVAPHLKVDAIRMIADICPR